MRYYTDPERASDKYALPDLEVWSDYKAELSCLDGCGVFTVPADSLEEIGCPSCETENVEALETSDKLGFWYWYCFPGCMPESSIFGVFDSEEEALEHARGD